MRWPGVNSLSSRSSQSEVMPIFRLEKAVFWFYLIDFPGQTNDFRV